jgi:hypothetical protein
MVMAFMYIFMRLHSSSFDQMEILLLSLSPSLFGSIVLQQLFQGIDVGVLHSQAPVSVQPPSRVKAAERAGVNGHCLVVCPRGEDASGPTAVDQQQRSAQDAGAPPSRTSSGRSARHPSTKSPA